MVAVLLEPDKDVLPSDYDSSSDAIIRDTAMRNRGMQQLKYFGTSEAKPGLEFTTRQHVSFAGQLSSFFVAAHA